MMNNPPTLPLDQILPGNCIDVLATLPEKSIDLIFADPPYNLQLQQDLYRPNQTRVDAVRDTWDQFESFEAYDQFCTAWLSACRRVLKDTGTLWVIGSYHNIYRIGAIMQNLGFWFLNDVVWIKDNPMPNFRGVRFTNAHETLLWASRQKGARYTFNHHSLKHLNDDLQMRSDWYLPICSGADRLKHNGQKAHSTQKPEALLYRVILASSNPGDVVLDPFLGSGTTAAAARRLRRQWIGIEKEASYIDIARERIDAVEPIPEDSAVFSADPRQRLARVPFGSLLENGWLRAGQSLFLRADRSIRAVILPDGHIAFNELHGSIHAVSSRLLNGAPTNGWELWHYEASDGTLHPINELRQQIRQKNGQSG